jgi:hypothetical protein
MNQPARSHQTTRAPRAEMAEIMSPLRQRNHPPRPRVSTDSPMSVSHMRCVRRPVGARAAAGAVAEAASGFVPGTSIRRARCMAKVISAASSRMLGRAMCPSKSNPSRLSRVNRPCKRANPHGLSTTCMK